ncbi:alkylhydroperoxidase family enzyme [Erythromicrobium ramosum]|uniref:Alkylhydroperoxidase family enzyme n=1 Tax=Erythrobacter ramosus TaxID=35811 RepID=A0A6I4UH94_9SPHN|nr:carboxymuconolactone decarboxylase family protein [Erythrobacter ramosus]MBB3776635.1 alkylhydroperoxidase family enzyme [Erythrobacter ramosus]MXP38290.1 carboxymuconolactone decarboxylase family protein [Erythrobacter ramosus]
MTNPPRIAHLNPPYGDAEGKALGRMMPKDSPVEPLKLFRTFARNLPFATAIGPLGGYMLSLGRDGGAGYDLRSRELVIDRVTARCGCEYEWGVHIASYARRAELTEEQIYATVHSGPDDPCWDDRDSAVLSMVDELHDTGKLTDATFDALRRHFDERRIIELFALAGWYHAISYVANGSRTELEDWAPRFPARRA